MTISFRPALRSSSPLMTSDLTRRTSPAIGHAVQRGYKRLGESIIRNEADSRSIILAQARRGGGRIGQSSSPSTDLMRQIERSLVQRIDAIRAERGLPPQTYVRPLNDQPSRESIDSLTRQLTELQKGRPGVGVGPYAAPEGGVPLQRPNSRPNASESRAIDEIFRRHGCHSCGTKESGTASGRPVGDHQPPSSLNWEMGPQRLYPHCTTCSARQGGLLSGQRRAIDLFSSHE